MLKSMGDLAKYPARSALAWYLAVTAIGTILLLLPVCQAKGREPISLVDAAFTATSATCVTGLTVRSTANDFSPIGQLVILLLIQLGGIGIITVTTFIMLRLGGSHTLRQTMAIEEVVGSRGEPSLRRVLGQVIALVFAIEAVGFAILAGRNLIDQSPSVALWHALFHSISAFCNAGFSLNDDSMVRYQADPVVNATMMTLIVVGGLGFPVLLDVRRVWRERRRELGDTKNLRFTFELVRRLHLHTKLMFVGTATLLTLGALAFLVFEWNHSLDSMSPGAKIQAALFHSSTSRTAGFFTVDVASLTTATLYVTMLLMATGAGPCSTGGGFKVSSLMVLGMYAFARFRGKSEVTTFRRSVPRASIERAFATVLLFAAVGACGLTALLAIEHSHGLTFMDISFETASALGTVGLSTGATSELQSASRLIVIVLMLVGRLGPITLFIALSQEEKKPHLKFPSEDVLIG